MAATYQNNPNAAPGIDYFLNQVNSGQNTWNGPPIPQGQQVVLSPMGQGGTTNSYLDSLNNRTQRWGGPELPAGQQLSFAPLGQSYNAQNPYVANQGYNMANNGSPQIANGQYLPYNAPSPYFGTGAGNNLQYQGSNVNQIPVNVLDVRNQLTDLLKNYQNQAAQYLNNFSSASKNIPTVNLANNYQGGNELMNSLNGGIDFFGQQGISQGLQNIGLQNNAANQQLQNTLGRHAGNESLINALQGQNTFKSQLAGVPLISEAQQGTYQRGLNNLNLNNQNLNQQNQNQINQQGFNLQSLLAGLSAQQQGLQPTQNLLDVLTNLQGQQRGVTSSQSQIGSQNYK